MVINEFASFVEFLKDPTLVENHLKGLKEENERLENNIKLSAELGEVHALKKAAVADRAAASAALAAAKETAEKLVKDAKTTYTGRTAALREREVATAQLRSEAIETIAEAKRINDVLNKELKDKLAFIEKQSQKLAADQEELSKRLRKLQEVMR